MVLQILLALLSASSGSGPMPRCWLKTTTKMRRPLKGGANG
jgi:hypothetical protein